jgi:outer membrane protein TolC
MTDYSLPFDASWTPDLWGRVRNTVKGNVAAAQASAADLQNTRLTAQAELAVDYYQLRSQDVLKQLLDATVVAYQKSLELTQALYQTGIDDDEAVAQAEVQLQTTQAQATNLAIARAQYEHAIALLVGQPASSSRSRSRPNPCGWMCRASRSVCHRSCSSDAPILPPTNASWPRPTRRSASPPAPIIRP